MRKVFYVAWREFKHTALTKAFIFAAVMVPISVLVLGILMPRLAKSKLPPLNGTLAVVDATGKLTDAIEFELKPAQVYQHKRNVFDEKRKPSIQDAANAARQASQASQATQPAPQIEVKLERHDAQADIAALKDRVRRKDLLGLVVIPANVIGANPSKSDNRFDMFVASDAAPTHTSMFEDAVASAIVRIRVQEAGLQLDQAQNLVREPDANIRNISAKGLEANESSDIKMLIPMAFMMLLWISTFVSGNYLLTTTIEEKSNKVMEVLLSAVSPFQLMAGKILGQAGVSFLMLAMYSGAGIAGLVFASKMNFFQPILLVYLAVYFFMAFFMIASIMAGVGSAVSELREAQSLITPAMLILMIPLMLWIPIINDPNGPLATISSFIPPVIPFVMILRVTAANEPIPFWQIIATIVSGYAWMIIMIWMCAKIFRVGVLMYGKPPTPLELLKWVRYS